MANEPTIEAMNLAIVEFMQVEKDRHSYMTRGRFRTVYLFNGRWLPLRELKYHTSWDWLMPVVEKIAKTVSMLEAPKNDYELAAFEILRRPIYTAISTIHNDVYQFITWYNDNQQKQNNG